MEWLAAVAHEIRNPLAAIRCAVRILKAPEQADATREEAQAVIDRQISRIARISDDLLDAGYVSAGKLELRKEPIDMRDIVGAAVETCRAQLDANGNDLILGLPPQPVALTADPLRLIQVVTNLLDNAVKYSEVNGTIIVHLEDLQNEVIVRVMDDGMGIAAEFLPHVFDLFAQAEEANSHGREGMGIGLNLVKRIVELHRGAVDAFSAGPGMGSTFTVRLPRNA